MKNNAIITRPHTFYIPLDRRRFLKAIAIASAGFTLPGFLAEAIGATPLFTQGPFYPLADDIPLDKDNDLVQVNDNLIIAAGVVSYITGTVYDLNGNPVKNALVELWHADREGDYLYSTGAGRNSSCDANFAGFGQFLTGSSGRFKFRTIKAGLYNGRTRHYHWGISLPGRTTRSRTQTGWNETSYDLNGNVWATQNANDDVFSTVTAAQRAAMLLDFTAVSGITTGEVEATWDFYSGFTAVEPTYPGSGSQLVAGELVAGPSSASRYKLTLPAYTGYTYEIYGNPTFAELEWRALPFCLSQTGAMDRHKHTAAADGSLTFYVEAAAERGFLPRRLPRARRQHRHALIDAGMDLKVWPE